jgi:hypothetical protein
MKRGLQVLLASLSLAAQLALAGTLHLSIKLTPSGGIYDEFRTGNDGVSTVLDCTPASLPQLALLQGDAFSSSARALFSGSGAATATLSVVHVSGDDAESEGWGISGDNLVNAGSGTGGGQFSIRAVKDATTFDCGPFNWTYTAAPMSDTTPPLRPYGFAATPGVGGVATSWDAVTDVPVGGLVSGVVQYCLQMDLGACTNVAAEGPGLQPTYTLGDPSSLSPTLTYSGGNFTLSVSGEIDGVPSRIAPSSPSQLIAGPAFMSGRVFNMAVAANYAKLGFCATSATLATDGCFGSGGITWLTLHALKNLDGTYMVQARARLAGNSAFNVPGVSVAVPSEPYLKLQEVSAGNWNFYYSLDGGPWILINATPYAFALPTNKRWAPFGSGGQGGTATTTGELRNVNLNNLPRQSYFFSTGSSGSLTVKAVDGASQTSFASVAQVAGPDTTPPPPSEGLLYDFSTFNCTPGVLTPTTLDAVGFKHSRHNGKIECSTEHARGTGKTSLKLTLKAPDCYTTSGGANPNCYGTTREEIYPNGKVVAAGSGAQGTQCSNDPTHLRCVGNGDVVAIHNGGDLWMGFSVYLTEIAPNAGAVLLQLQQGGDSPCGWGQPMWAHSINAGGLNWRSFHRPWETTDVCDDADHFGSFQQIQGTFGSINLNEWTDFVYHFVFDPSAPPNIGSYTVWQNGVQVLQRTNVQFGYNINGTSMDDMLIKNGFYHWNPNIIGHYIGYFGEYRTALPGEGSYELVAPRGTGKY